jgi:hypothetical protein
MLVFPISCPLVPRIAVPAFNLAFDYIRQTMVMILVLRGVSAV